MVFPPVRVSTDEEVACVVALVTEKAEEYNMKNNISGRKPQIQYSTEAAMARSILDEKIVSHIKFCFTKKGMKDLKLGRRKWTNTKRKDIIKIPSETMEGEEDELSPVEEEMEVEEETGEGFEELLDEAAEELVPTEDEIKLALEGKVFGGLLPKTVRRLKPPRNGVSDRKGRGGRNEFTKRNVPESLVLGAVDLMLGGGSEDQEHQQATISLAGLFRKRRSRRKRINIDFDDLSDDEDETYKAPSNCNRKVDRPNEENKRKSRRLSGKQKRIDSGEYFDAQNHIFFENQEHSEGFFKLKINEDHTTQDEFEIFSSGCDSIAEISRLVPEFETKFLAGQTDVVQEQQLGVSIKSNVGDWTERKSTANINENYLRSSKIVGKLGIFDQAYTRKKHSDKVLKVIEKQKKKAEKLIYKKYKGFGEKVDPEQNLVRRKVKKEEKTHERKVKKAQVSKPEADLIKVLLEVAESAVAAASFKSASDASQGSSVDTAAIQMFEEVHTFATDEDFVEDFQNLFELN
eukprot:GFUD01022747.1.p1 GENE.GFUD01022747.1~~GFUD01022747.1.p1  ORF type:complete len:557 (-),score=190.99 GFUD01022747.1:36-1589(-)